MRNATGFLLFASFGIVALAQSPNGPYNIPAQIRTLTIVSSDMSSELRQNIVRAFQSKTYSLEELQARIRRGLGDIGFAKASVEIPGLATMPIHSAGQPVDVTVRVSVGAIYQISEIQFERRNAFQDELRRQFPVANGDVFKATAIEEGLNNLRDLYASHGYINFGAVPNVQFDDVQHTLALTIVLDEGAQYYFGRLLFHRAHPDQPAMSKLRRSWNSIEGKPYDYHLLEKWIRVNSVSLPGAAKAPDKAVERYVTAHQSDETHRVDIELRLP